MVRHVTSFLLNIVNSTRLNILQQKHKGLHFLYSHPKKHLWKLQTLTLQIPPSRGTLAYRLFIVNSIRFRLMFRARVQLFLESLMHLTQTCWSSPSHVREDKFLTTFTINSLRNSVPAACGWCMVPVHCAAELNLSQSLHSSGIILATLLLGTSPNVTNKSNATYSLHTYKKNKKTVRPVCAGILFLQMALWLHFKRLVVHLAGE